MTQLFRRLVAFVAAVFSFLRHKIRARRHHEPDPEPEMKDPDEEAMTDEKMRDVWHKARLGEILVENNAVAVVRTLTGVLEIPKLEEPRIASCGKWILGSNNDLQAALAPRKKES